MVRPASKDTMVSQLFNNGKWQLPPPTSADMMDLWPLINQTEIMVNNSW